MNESVQDLLRQGADEVERPRVDVSALVVKAEQRLFRRRVAVVAASAAAVVLVAAGGVALRPDDRPSPAPPVTPSPSPTPSVEFESPGPRDHPIALAKLDGGLVLATLDQVERPGTATIWRRDADRWQRVGSLEDAVPRHLNSDSNGTRLVPGPGSQDLVASSSSGDGLRFSQDGGATWAELPAPESCKGRCLIGRFGDDFYALGPSYENATTLWRASFGTTTWEERQLPPSADPKAGYTNLVVMEDGTVALEEAGGCVAGATGHYRVSRDHGATWSERRALPGSSNCLTGTRGDLLYAHCNTTSCYYDTGGDGGGGGFYQSTDLVHWEPTEHPDHFGNWNKGYALPQEGRACPSGLGVDPVYNWVEEPAVRVGREVFKLFHVPGTRGHEHELLMSRDDCKTWTPAVR